MHTADKQYNLNQSEENDLLDRKKHEEEMEKVLLRMENAKRRKRKTLYCGVAGFVVGVLYIVYIALYITLELEWVDALLSRLSGGNSIIRLILDFLPPILISGIAAYFIARKEKGVVIYIFSSISVFLVVLLVFLVYVSLMMA